MFTKSKDVKKQIKVNITNSQRAEIPLKVFHTTFHQKSMGTQRTVQIHMRLLLPLQRVGNTTLEAKHSAVTFKESLASVEQLSFPDLCPTHE